MQVPERCRSAAPEAEAVVAPAAQQQPALEASELHGAAALRLQAAVPVETSTRAAVVAMVAQHAGLTGTELALCVRAVHSGGGAGGLGAAAELEATWAVCAGDLARRALARKAADLLLGVRGAAG